jgi:hypothetical protein
MAGRLDVVGGGAPRASGGGRMASLARGGRLEGRWRVRMLVGGSTGPVSGGRWLVVVAGRLQDAAHGR